MNQHPKEEEQAKDKEKSFSSHSDFGLSLDGGGMGRRREISFGGWMVKFDEKKGMNDDERETSTTMS